MNLTITQKHVEAAVINSVTAGPIALAAREKGLRNAIEGQRTLRWQDQDGRWLVAALPLKAIEFLNRLNEVDRHEVLPLERVVKRTRVKEDSLVVEEKWWHSPLVLEIPAGIIAQEWEPHRVGRRTWGTTYKPLTTVMRGVRIR